MEITNEPDLINNLWLSSFRDNNRTTKLAQFIYNLISDLFVYLFLIVLQRRSDPCVVIFDPQTAELLITINLLYLKRYRAFKQCLLLKLIYLPGS